MNTIYYCSGNCVCGDAADASARVSQTADRCDGQVLILVCDLHFMHLNFTVFFFTIIVELVSVVVLQNVELKILATDVSESKLPFQSQLLSYDTYFMNLQHLKNATN